MTTKDLINLIVSCLTDDLRRAPWKGSANKVAGHCYVASEALYHFLGASSGYVPCFIRHEGSPHWFLRHMTTGEVLDPTISQFKNIPQYQNGVRKGFLTKSPSKRAKELLRRMNGTERLSNW